MFSSSMDLQEILLKEVNY